MGSPTRPGEGWQVQAGKTESSWCTFIQSRVAMMHRRVVNRAKLCTTAANVAYTNVFHCSQTSYAIIPVSSQRIPQHRHFSCTHRCRHTSGTFAAPLRSCHRQKGSERPHIPG